MITIDGKQIKLQIWDTVIYLLLLFVDLSRNMKLLIFMIDICYVASSP